MLHRDGVVTMVMMVLVMMMIPMNPSSMMVTMAMISPLREGISLAELFLSLSIFLHAEAAEYFSDGSPSLKFLGQ
jgi:hypothetical protein